MSGRSFAQREASRGLYEPARVVDFQDLSPTEEFSTCIHLTKGSQPRRCRNQLSPRDSQKAKVCHSKIQCTLEDDMSLPDLLSQLAIVTLCNHAHRPKDGMDALADRMANKWGSDLGIGNQATIPSIVEEVTTNEIYLRAASVSETSSTSANAKERRRTSVKPGNQESSPSDLRVDNLLPNMPPKLDINPSRSARRVPSYDIPTEANGLHNHETSTFGSEPRANQLSRLRPLPGRAASPRSPTAPNAEYLLYPHKLQSYTKLQLTKYINQTLVGRLARPLTSTGKGDGYVYIFSRPGDEPLVKIGFTRNPPEGRVSQWGTKCFYASKREFATELIPHAWQLEKIVEIALARYRREEQQCKWNANCGKKHREWYEISVDQARKVIERWAAWITKYRPWGPDHALKPEWMSLLEKYRIASRSLDQHEGLWDSWLRMEGPRMLEPVIRIRQSQAQGEEEHPSTTVRFPTPRQYPEEQPPIDLPRRTNSTSRSSSSSSSPHTPQQPRLKTKTQLPSPPQSPTTASPLTIKVDSLPSSSSSHIQLQLSLPTALLPPKTLQTLLRFQIPSSPSLPASPATMVH